MRSYTRLPLVLAVSLPLSAAWAQGGARTSPEAEAATDDAPIGAATADGDDTAARLAALEEENRRLSEQLQLLAEDLEWAQTQQAEREAARAKISGYLDLGFFYAQGDGSGIRTDVGYQHFPRYRGVVPDSWVFLGDPLSTTVNARGEPADTGESRAVTFDSVNSGGRPSFILNSMGLSVFAGLGETLTFNAALDVVPRVRDVSDPFGVFVGDFVDLKLAYAEWRIPGEDVSVSVFAGKFDSVVGIEYRSQDAPDRLGITPSLICRYTCGRPIGLKARASIWEETFTANLAVTNGTNFSEMFPFYDEVDSNAPKTVSARLSYRLDVGSGIEFGVSGAAGAQDNQPDPSALQWHLGFDLKADVADVVLSAEYVRGIAPGVTRPGEPPCNTAQCLSYRGAYGLLGYRATNWVTPYVRVDWRDAVHQQGASFVYISKGLRVTGGAQFELGPHVLIKAEYLLNRDLDPLPSIPNDVFTSSFVARF